MPVQEVRHSKQAPPEEFIDPDISRQLSSQESLDFVGIPMPPPTVTLAAETSAGTCEAAALLKEGRDPVAVHEIQAAPQTAPPESPVLMPERVAYTPEAIAKQSTLQPEHKKKKGFMGELSQVFSLQCVALQVLDSHAPPYLL